MIVKKIQAVIFDWAGTTIDYGCRAPLMVFLELFKKKGIPISIEEASRPMGKLKIEHIRELLTYERIKSEYIKLYKIAPNENTVQELNSEFEKALFAILPSHTQPIPGVINTVQLLRNQGLKIGSTTGYTKPMMDIVVPYAEKQGYKPDYLITSSEVKQGRPFPWMIYQNSINLGVSPMSNIVKVGDTIADIKEGNNAECWSVGIIEGSSLMEFDIDGFTRADKKIINQKKNEIRNKYYENGADFVINSFSELPQLIEEISEKMNSQNLYPGGKMTFPKQPYKLYTPGPLTTTQSVKLSMMTDWGSRENDYLELVQRVRKELVDFAAEKNREKYSTIIMQGSGTFGVESCIGSVVPKDGKILVLINGEYGKRMSNIAKILGINTVDYTVDENEVHSLEKIEQYLKSDKTITHVGLIHSETTTGILNPIETICPLIKKYEKVSIVDAMSSFGAVPFDVEKLGIDFMVSSSNKNIEGIPGVSFIIANKDQLEKCKSIKPRSLSLDLYDQYAYLEKNKGGFRFTSPVHCIKALDQAVKELKLEGGIQARHKRYSDMHKKLVEGMNSMKFKKLDLKEYQGPIITTFHTPKCTKYNFNQFYNRLKDNKCIIYPGKLAKTDSFRIGTIGSIGVEDIEYLLQCVEGSIFWDNSL